MLCCVLAGSILRAEPFYYPVLLCKSTRDNIQLFDIYFLYEELLPVKSATTYKQQTKLVIREKENNSHLWLYLQQSFANHATKFNAR